MNNTNYFGETGNICAKSITYGDIDLKVDNIDVVGLKLRKVSKLGTVSVGPHMAGKYVHIRDNGDGTITVVPARVEV